jgi:Tol biopolymer transport system component
MNDATKTPPGSSESPRPNQSSSASAKTVMLMNRIGPSQSELYIANADGSGERKLLSTSGGFDYHPTFSYDGQWIVFTSERSGSGKADLYRVHPGGDGLEQLTGDPAMDDQGALSPDGANVAFVSSRETHRANIWILDLRTKKMRNLTGAIGIQGDPLKPNGFYRPQWSPDGNWIAFSSDRNTDWRTHDDNVGWEHLQELAIYVARPDGSEFRRITGSGITSGSPKWSADSKRIVYYEMPVQTSWLARVDQLSKSATSQIVSVNLETGKRTVHTHGEGLKMQPQFLPAGRIGHTTKSAQTTGITYTDAAAASFPENMRSPSWSPDGAQVVYAKIDNTSRPQYQLLYSWDAEFELRYTDVFPSFSADGTLVVTAKDVDSSIVTMNADGTNRKLVFKSATKCSGNQPGPCGDMDGVAFGPSWSPDGEWIVFSFGGYLRLRKTHVAKIMLIRRDGADLQELTTGTPNAGFPSFSPDGKEVVYRTWGPNQEGLRIMNLETRQVRVLTDQLDNLPHWSVNNVIVFTRRSADNVFDIFTIHPDGANLKKLTGFPAADGHAVWSWDGKHIMWNSSERGFKDEASLYDNTFQPYGQNWMMNADGTNKRQLTDSHWEDSMPCIVPPYARFGSR